MIERDLSFLCIGSIATMAIFIVTIKATDFFVARNSTDARINRRTAAVERRVIRAVILGGAVK